MRLDLTAVQNADRERTGACVVPGEFARTRTVRSGDGVQSWSKDEYTPPQQWRDADGPCPTCDGSGDANGWDGSEEAWYPCRDCVKGKIVVNVQVPCPTCAGDPHPCWKCKNKSYVVVARATVTLLPVWDVHDNNDHHEARHVCISGDRAFIDAATDQMRVLPFDPLPVAGRDWVAAFGDVT